MLAKLYINSCGGWKHYTSYYILDYVTCVYCDGYYFSLRADGNYYEGEPSYNWVNHVGR